VAGALCYGRLRASGLPGTHLAAGPRITDWNEGHAVTSGIAWRN
jgi:hypothetical protein